MNFIRIFTIYLLLILLGLLVGAGKLSWINNYQGIITLFAIIIGGIEWWETSKLNRKLQQEEFILDKKYKGAEKLLDALTIYDFDISKLLGEIEKWRLKIRVNGIRSHLGREGGKTIGTINGKWLTTDYSYVRLLKTYENNEIAILEIKTLMDKFKEKVSELDEFFRNKFLYNIKDYSNIAINDNDKTELSDLLDEADKIILNHSAYIYDMTIGIQNRLLSDVFNRKAPLRNPTVNMEVLS